MTTDRPCPTCGRDLPADRYVCTACTGRLRGLLTDLGGLMGDLDAALAKQLRFGARVGSRSTSTPLPINLTASEAGYVARQTILTWVDWVTAVRGHQVPQTWAGIGTYLQAAVDWVAAHPDGPACIEELTAAIRQARRAVDRPADRHYAGKCPNCGHPLHASNHDTTTTCTRCGVPTATAELRVETQRRIENHELHAVEAARLLAGIGLDVPARLIRLWKHRGQLNTAGVDRDGRPLYRVGDILRRHAQTTETKVVA